LGRANDFSEWRGDHPAIPVANLISEITTLAAAGGKQFLVPNLPLLGDLPATNTLPQAESQCLELPDPDLPIASCTPSSTSFKGNWIALDGRVTLYQSIIANPSEYGLTNVTDSRSPTANLSGAGYLFWTPCIPQP